MRAPAPVRAPRCGACDALGHPSQPLAICEQCNEPTCAKHLERVWQEGDPCYICSVCADERKSLDPEVVMYREPAALAGAAA